MFKTYCTLCIQSITDPICTRCYIKQVRMWFNDMGINPLINDFAMEKIKNRLLFETINETECIICKNENVNVCFYCFMSLTIQIFKEINLSNEMIDHFSEFFNYELMGRELKIPKIEDNSKLEKEYYDLDNESFDEGDEPENLEDWASEFELSY